MMARKPLVSVVIPAYNVGPYLRETIESVLAQSVDNMEVIVVNDGSTDNTEEVAHGFGDSVLLVNQSNSGAAKARNVALARSRGEYVAFLDGDDVWHTGNLEAKLEVLERERDAGAVFGNFEIFDESGTSESDGIHSLYPVFRRHGQDIQSIFTDGGGPDTVGDRPSKAYVSNVFRDLFLGNFILTSTLLVRKEVVENVGYFAEEFRTNQDYEFFLRLSKMVDLAYVDKALVKYRRRNTQLTSKSNIVNVMRAVEKIVRQYEHEFLVLNLSSRFRRRHAQVLTDLAKAELAVGDRAQSRKAFIGSIKCGAHALDNYAGLVLSLLPARVTEKLIGKSENLAD